MSNLTKSILGFSIYLIIATATSPCNSCNKSHSDTAEGKLEFFGRVQSGRNSLLQNDRLVILFLNGIEVGRDITHIGKYPTSEEPANDGFYSISIPNQYELTEEEIANAGYTTDGVSKYENAKNLKWGSLTTISVDKCYEGLSKEFSFSRNNTKYTIKVMYGEYSNLSALIRESNSTFLDETGNVYALSFDNIKNATTEIVELKHEDYPMNNCGGNSPLTQTPEFRAKMVHEYNFSVTTSTLVPMLLSKFQTKFGFHDLQEYEDKKQMTFTVKPKTKVIYTITWYEVWERGTVEVKTENETKVVGFKVKTKLNYEINSKSVSCR